MRIFKFRGWYKKKKYMIYQAIINFDGRVFDILCEIGDQSGHEELTNDVELMQFTGFKDSEGNEIYEGDIITYKQSGHIGQQLMDDYKGQVVFKEGMFVVNYWPEKNYDDYLCNCLEHSYIVGNIYQDSYLIDLSNKNKTLIPEHKAKIANEITIIKNKEKNMTKEKIKLSPDEANMVSHWLDKLGNLLEIQNEIDKAIEQLRKFGIDIIYSKGEEK